MGTKLWILRPKDSERDNSAWDPWYDKAFGFVVRAETEQQARELAQEDCGDEGEQAWADQALSTCEPLSDQGSAGVIIRDFASA